MSPLCPLAEAMLESVVKWSPAMAIFENVAGFATEDENADSPLRYFTENLKKAGYLVASTFLNLNVWAACERERSCGLQIL